MKNSTQILKSLREKNGLSCKDMADLLKISKPYYWQVENGTRGLYYSMAKQIASIFKMKPDEIFFDDV